MIVIAIVVRPTTSGDLNWDQFLWIWKKTCSFDSRDFGWVKVKAQKTDLHLKGKSLEEAV